MGSYGGRWGDVGRYGENYLESHGELWGAMGRCGEMWGDMGRAMGRAMGVAPIAIGGGADLRQLVGELDKLPQQNLFGSISDRRGTPR